jgi:chemotaxis signal transduction protein
VTTPPKTGGRIEQAFASGLATVEGRMVTILDIDALIASALAEF